MTDTKDGAIRPEIVLTSTCEPALDGKLVPFTEVEWEFLHSLISRDDKELRHRLLAVQKQCVHTSSGVFQP